MRCRVRKAANDPYWEPGVRLALGAVSAVILAGIGAVLLVGQLFG